MARRRLAARGARAAAGDAGDRDALRCVGGELGEQFAGFHRGLSEAGFVEGRNVAIDYRWAEGQFDRLPAMAADLVGRKVAVILVGGSDLATRAAMAATQTIPIVFTTAADPVVSGLSPVSTGRAAMPPVSPSSARELEQKRLELLHEVLPTASNIALLVNPNNPVISQDVIQRTRAAARASGWRSSSSTAAPGARSRAPSRLLSNSGPPRSLSVPMRSSTASANRLPLWLCAMRCPRSPHRVRPSSPAS